MMSDTRIKIGEPTAKEIEWLKSMDLHPSTDAEKLSACVDRIRDLQAQLAAKDAEIAGVRAELAESKKEEEHWHEAWGTKKQEWWDECNKNDQLRAALQRLVREVKCHERRWDMRDCRNFSDAIDEAAALLEGM